jgi:filamentous hemagglutinin
LYGTSDSNALSEEQKQTVSALSTLAAGLSGGLVEGNSAGAIAGAGAGRNAVENNLLANKYGIERLDAASRALYEKLKAAGIGSVDELHERFKGCGGNGDCEAGIRDEYRQQDKQAGEKLVELYQSGRLSKAEYDLLVTDYALAMMKGAVDAQKSDPDASFLDVYALSGADWSPMGVVANPYVKAIRSSELIAQWRQQGLSEEQINERARQDGLLGSTLAPVDVPGIIKLVDDGATRENVVQLATALILGKVASGTKEVGAVGKKLPSALPENLTGYANPKDIRFTQDSVSNTFKDGQTLQSTIDGLKSGKISPDDLPPIRVFEKDGAVYSLDNRRLLAASEAGVPIKVVPATPAEVAREGWKMTTPNNGSIICVRGVCK